MNNKAFVSLNPVYISAMATNICNLVISLASIYSLEMTIDIYSKEDRNHTKCLYRLSYKDFIRLAPFFEEFEQRTSIFVNPYGKTNMSSGHLGILSRILSGNHLQLENILTKYASEGQDLVFEGD